MHHLIVLNQGILRLGPAKSRLWKSRIEGGNDSMLHKKVTSAFPLIYCTSQCMDRNKCRVWNKWILPERGPGGIQMWYYKKTQETFLSFVFERALKVSFLSFLKLSGIWQMKTQKSNKVKLYAQRLKMSGFLLGWTKMLHNVCENGLWPVKSFVNVMNNYT